MNISCRKASAEDLELLVRTRIETLRAANGLAADADMSNVEAESRAYYLRALADGTHAAYLAFDGDIYVGTGGISDYRVMPTYHNPTGRKAYIMNMYVRPEYRRQGIAFHMLDLLVRDAAARGIFDIALEATEQGRPLYERYGFVPLKGEMGLPTEGIPPKLRK